MSDDVRARRQADQAGHEPSRSTASRPVGDHPSRERAEAEAKKREAHKSPGLRNGKSWRAVHNSVRGWHVALVDDEQSIKFQAFATARAALVMGDAEAFVRAASDALMAGIRADLARDSDRSGEAGETHSGSTVGESAGASAHRPNDGTGEPQ